MFLRRSPDLSDRGGVELRLHFALRPLRLLSLALKPSIGSFSSFISSVGEMRRSGTHSGYDWTGTLTVGLHLNFCGDLAELSARNPHFYLRETLTWPVRDASVEG